jgi:hypothetical protein
MTLLYKYRPKPNKYLKKLLIERELYFSSPSNFNDPFDCYPLAEYNGSDEEIKTHLRPKAQRLFSAASSGDVENAMNELLADKDKFNSAVAKFSAQDSLDDTKIYCLTASPTSILMWSHYAEYHRGICLGFDAKVGTIFGRASKVEYVDKRLVINLLADNPDYKANVRKSFFEKSKDWHYEEEYRILSPDDNYIHHYEPHDLKKIIFGAKISQEDKATVMQWYEELDFQPELFQAQLHGSRYQIQIEPLG